MIAAYAGFGRSARVTVSPVIAAHGGKVMRSFIVSPATTDLSAILAEVKELDPNEVAVFNADASADAGASAVTAFVIGAGLKARLTTAMLYRSDVNRTGNSYVGMQVVMPWYWNLDPAACAWANRFPAAHDSLRS